MNSDFQVLEKELLKRKFVFKEKEFFVGKLSFIQVTKLIKALAKIFVKGAERFKNIKAGSDNKDDVISIIEQLDEKELCEVLSIITGLDTADCQELEFKSVTEIIETILDYNLEDFKDIIKNWQRIASKLQARQSA